MTPRDYCTILGLAAGLAVAVWMWTRPPQEVKCATCKKPPTHCPMLPGDTVCCGCHEHGCER